MPNIPPGQATIWYGTADQFGNYSLLARWCDLGATGIQIEPKEGPCIKQADVSTITCQVFNLGTDQDNPSGTPVSPAPTLTASVNIYDTLQTAGWPTNDDHYGYNFRHDVGVLYTQVGGDWYLLVYQIVLTNGSTSYFKVKVQIQPTQ